MALGLFHYQIFSTILETIHYIFDETALSNTVLAQLSQALSTEGGTIFRIDSGEKITPLASCGAAISDLKQMEFAYGRGVVGWVAKYNQAVKLDNPQSDPRFIGNVDVITGFKTRSIIAAPILSKGRLVGIIELLNKKTTVFTAADMELISMVGRELGRSFENLKLIQHMEESLNSLNAGLIVVDKDNNVPIINSRAAKILGIKADQVQDSKRYINELASMAPDFFAFLKITAEAGKTIPRGQIQIKINNSEMVLGYSTVPRKDENGGYTGMTFLFQDITGYFPSP